VSKLIVLNAFNVLFIFLFQKCVLPIISITKSTNQLINNSTAMQSILELFKLNGKTALVMGGNRGLGLEMCKALAEAGANIAIAARD
jgi:hypothetical protein